MLKITGKREDGFHEIFSIVDKISIYDIVTAEKSEEDIIAIPGIEENDNSVLRALRIFREKTGFSDPLCITVSKKIPVQSGLGGASSDAAATLFLLQKISGIELSQRELFDIGEKLGADVPLFLSEGPCVMWGKGEKVYEISLPFERWYVVIKPEKGLSTKKVYEEYDREPVTHFLNDLEESATNLLPEIADLLSFLREKKVLLASMTGSGSAVFALLETKNKASAIFKEAKEKFPNCEVFLAQGLNCGFRTGLIENR